MSASLYTLRSSNVRKTFLLMILYLGVFTLFGYIVSVVFDTPIIFYVFVVIAVVMNILSYWNSDKIVLSLSRAKPVDRKEHREVWNILENLCISTGQKMPKFYIMEEKAPNAFATGRNPENSAIVLTTGLMEMLDKNELQGVIAHELAHINNRDTLLMTSVAVLTSVIALIADFGLHMILYGNTEIGSKEEGALKLVLFIVAILLIPIVASVIKLSISRKREFLADSTGALYTRYPEGLASALEKIEGSANEMKHAHSSTAHLFIANPLKGGKKGKGFIKKLFATHPPTSERIDALRKSL